MKILAISGSLRAASTNRTVLEAAARLAPEGMEIELYQDLAALEPFNPDQDETPPAVAAGLRSRVGMSDGILISSPEYAHGIAGVLKNALDWLVGSLEFPEKPVALYNTSPRAFLAEAALIETLRTMSAHLPPEASLALALSGRNLDAAGVAADPEFSAQIRAALTAFARAIEKKPAA